MLDLLPFDIILHITQFLNDTHPIILIKDLYSKEYYSEFMLNRVIHANRIKLCFRLFFHKKILFNTLKQILDKHYYIMLSKKQKSYPLFNNQCILYAPFVPYEKCRFCSFHLHKHKYNKMIRMYLELVY